MINSQLFAKRTKFFLLPRNTHSFESLAGWDKNDYVYEIKTSFSPLFYRQFANLKLSTATGQRAGDPGQWDGRHREPGMGVISNCPQAPPFFWFFSHFSG
jgi:hypothetical protein